MTLWFIDHVTHDMKGFAQLLMIAAVTVQSFPKATSDFCFLFFIMTANI